MLLEAGRVLNDLPTWSPRGAISWRLQKLGIRAVFVNAPLDEEDARNALRAGKVESLLRGAEIVAWRGAGLCLGCGVKHNREDRYCASCSPYPSERRADDHAAREVLRAVAEQLDIQTDGPQSRRARRRRTPY
jgi:hypothetical protein